MSWPSSGAYGAHSPGPNQAYSPAPFQSPQYSQQGAYQTSGNVFHANPQPGAPQPMYQAQGAPIMQNSTPSLSYPQYGSQGPSPAPYTAPLPMQYQQNMNQQQQYGYSQGSSSYQPPMPSGISQSSWPPNSHSPTPGYISPAPNQPSYHQPTQGSPVSYQGSPQPQMQNSFSSILSMPSIGGSAIGGSVQTGQYQQYQYIQQQQQQQQQQQTAAMAQQNLSPPQQSSQYQSQQSSPLQQQGFQQNYSTSYSQPANMQQGQYQQLQSGPPSTMPQGYPHANSSPPPQHVPTQYVPSNHMGMLPSNQGLPPKHDFMPSQPPASTGIPGSAKKLPMPPKQAGIGARPLPEVSTQPKTHDTMTTGSLKTSPTYGPSSSSGPSLLSTHPPAAKKTVLPRVPGSETSDNSNSNFAAELSSLVASGGSVGMAAAKKMPKKPMPLPPQNPSGAPVGQPPKISAPLLPVGPPSNTPSNPPPTINMDIPMRAASIGGLARQASAAKPVKLEPGVGSGSSGAPDNSLSGGSASKLHPGPTPSGSTGLHAISNPALIGAPLAAQLGIPPSSADVGGVKMARSSSSANVMSTNPVGHEFTSTLVPTTKEAIKAAQYAQYSSTGENHSEIPSKLFQSKRINTHTISILDSPKITKMSSKLNTLKSLVSLTIRGCSITAIYGIDILGATLMKLDLGKNRISIIPDWISNLQNLQVLTLDNNALNVIPKTINQLPSLLSLDLSNNYLSQIEISGLSSLTSLAIASNNFTIVPNSIDRLQELQTLDLGHNRFEMLPRNIYSLPKLQCLITSGNKLGDMPAEICLAQKLNTLHWDDNRASKLHDGLFMLTKLTNLKLGRNTIGEMSERVSRLTSLRMVELDSNQFDILPHQLCALPKLELSVSGNPFRSIPEEIRNQGQAAIIQFLRQLSSKAPWRRMKLMLVGNGNIGKTSLKRALATVPIPSTSIISVERAGRIKDRAFDALKRAASTASGVVSNAIGSSGDSSSSSASTFDPTDTIATDGIDIDDWVIDLEDYPDCIPATPVKQGEEAPTVTSDSDDALANTAVLSCYDFAGQDVYYPTHSLFVTSRSIYLVMFSLKDLEGSRVEYWLQMVQAKAGYTSPVIIVATHEDHRSVDRSSIADMLAQVKKKYSRFAFVKGVVSISSKTGSGIHSLRKQIVSLALSHATMKEQVPRSYILLESEVKKRRKAFSTTSNSASNNQQTMTFEEWYTLAEKCMIKREDAITALNFMADVGVVFHFKSNPESATGPNTMPQNQQQQNGEAGLDNVIILDPQWIADLLSTVISLKHNYIRDGVLESSVLPQLWKTYPAELHQSLIALLKRFEIVLPMASSGKFIVPSMLSTEEMPLMKHWQGHGQWYGPMARLLSMKFCPMGFFGRFVARAIHLPKIKVISYSMTYFVCEHPSTGERAVVAYNEWTYEILIWTASLMPLSPSERSLLYTLSDCLDILHESLYASNRRTQWIVCPHCIKSGVAEPTLFEYDDALIAFTDNIPTLPCYNEVASEAPAESHSGLKLRTASVASFAAFIAGSAKLPSQPQSLARVSSSSHIAPPSNGHMSGPDLGWTYLPTMDVFPSFTQRKEKHKSESVFIEEYGENGEVIPKPSRPKFDVPLERMAPDISFHSLGDMVVPYDSVKLGNLVAVGGFAEIYKSDFRGETVAVKKFLSSKESETGGPAVGVSPEFADAFRELQHEAFLMAKLRHPNVVSLHALCVRPICMIMEWIPEGTLGEVLFGEKAVPLNWETRLKYAMDIATGLAYLHAQSIMHLDFRSPNLLIKSKSSSSPVCVKVADFGLSTNSSGSHKGLKAFNPYWSSPEVILRKTYDLSTDIYSLGIVLWELLQNGRPFEEHQSKFKGGPEIVFSNAIANDGLRPTFPAGTPESLKKLISDCWQASAELRPCAADVVRSLEEILREFHRNPNAWAAPFFLPAPASSSPK